MTQTYKEQEKLFEYFLEKEPLFIRDRNRRIVQFELEGNEDTIRDAWEKLSQESYEKTKEEVNKDYGEELPYMPKEEALDLQCERTCVCLVADQVDGKRDVWCSMVPFADEQGLFYRKAVDVYNDYLQSEKAKEEYKQAFENFEVSPYYESPVPDGIQRIGWVYFDTHLDFEKIDDRLAAARLWELYQSKDWFNTIEDICFEEKGFFYGQGGDRLLPVGLQIAIPIYPEDNYAEMYDAKIGIVMADEKGNTGVYGKTFFMDVGHFFEKAALAVYEGMTDHSLEKSCCVFF